MLTIIAEDSTGPNGALVFVLVTLVAAVVAGLVLSKRRSSDRSRPAGATRSGSASIVAIAPPAFALALLAIGVNVLRHADARRLESRIARLESTVAHADAELLAAEEAKRAISRATDEPLFRRLPAVALPPSSNEEVPPPEKGGKLVVESASWRVASSSGVFWDIRWEAIVRNAGDTPGARVIHVELLDARGFLVDAEDKGSGTLEPGSQARIGGELSVYEKAGPLISKVETTVVEEAN